MTLRLVALITQSLRRQRGLRRQRRNELGIVAECVYLGQVTGSESNRSYIREPQEWIVEGSAWGSHQTLAFEWRWGEGVAVVQQLCTNVQMRGVCKPTDLSTRNDTWCKSALAQLHRAANGVTDTRGPNRLDEFGLQLQCEYKYQDKTMEQGPVAWFVQGRRSHCKVGFEISIPGVASVLSEPAMIYSIENLQQ